MKTEVSIELTAGQGIRGALRCDGGPISGARITAVSASGGPESFGTSAPDGFYEISGLPAGDYELAIEARGPAGETLERSVRATVADGAFAEVEIDIPVGLTRTR